MWSLGDVVLRGCDPWGVWSLWGVVLREDVVLGGVVLRVCGPLGDVVLRRVGLPPNRQTPPEVGTPPSGTRKAGGTQPTRMLSCAKKFSPPLPKGNRVSFALAFGWATEAGGTHPTGIHSCLDGLVQL